MKSVRWSAVAAAAAGLLLGVLPAGPAGAGTSTWHVLSASAVDQTRLTQAQITAIDPNITTVTYGTGGEANFEKCGLQRTEKLSLARNTQWEAGARTGIILIMQFTNVTDAQSIFDRARTAYVNCTPATFDNDPNIVSVKGSYVSTKKELRLQWAVYADAAKTITKKANGITIRRAGASLIITRSSTQDLATIKQPINSKLTGKQYASYRSAAFF